MMLVISDLCVLTPLPQGQRLRHCTVIAACPSQVHDGLRRENVPCVAGDMVRDSEKRAEMEM